MGEFVAIVWSFPTVIFTLALVVVMAFWLGVLVGAVEHDTFSDHAFGADAGTGASGLGGVPITVTVSLSVSLAWVLTLTGSVPLGRLDLPAPAHAVAGVGVLLVAVGTAWVAARALLRPLRHLFPDEPGPSRTDFVGTTCVIRTGRVDEDFGQAEVTARDGTSALVQVRQNGTDVIAAGSTGLLYAYDEAGEFFWVAPYDAALDPGPPTG